MAKNDTAKISLTGAAFELGISYERTLRLVLCRKLDGSQVDGRSWKVTAASVDRYKREREQLLEPTNA